mmetsp:Transcript_4926/g.14345  ORF Transcript_4926/g.14345 Transcript_4926/m.14345 type:complete len:429 (+) Transcript_4926:423-1709(+)
MHEVHLGEGVADVHEAVTGFLPEQSPSPPQEGLSEDVEEGCVPHLQLAEGHGARAQRLQRGRVQLRRGSAAQLRGRAGRQHGAGDAGLAEGGQGTADLGHVHAVQPPPHLNGEDVEEGGVLAGELCEAVECGDELLGIEAAAHLALPQPGRHGDRQALIVHAALGERADCIGAVLGRELPAAASDGISSACEHRSGLWITAHGARSKGIEDSAELARGEERNVLRNHAGSSVQKVARNGRHKTGRGELRKALQRSGEAASGGSRPLHQLEERLPQSRQHPVIAEPQQCMRPQGARQRVGIKLPRALGQRVPEVIEQLIIAVPCRGRSLGEGGKVAEGRRAEQALGLQRASAPEAFVAVAAGRGAAREQQQRCGVRRLRGIVAEVRRRRLCSARGGTSRPLPPPSRSRGRGCSAEAQTGLGSSSSCCRC